MRTISENFQLIFDKQSIFQYNFPKILQKPADESEIIQAEDVLNLKFNSELNELYRFGNGTKIGVDSELTFGMIGLMPIYRFLNLNDAVAYYNNCINIGDRPLNDFFLNFVTEYKPGNKLFPFLEDSAGNCYWVDLNIDTENYQKIFWTNTVGEQPDYTFTSLTSMFQTIAECYEKNVFWFDEEKYLECDYKQFYLICRKNNPSIQHWNNYISE